MTSLLGFPNPVNEIAARAVAAGVVMLTVLTIGLGVLAGPGWLWLTALIAAGFVARVLSGPRFSVLGQLATRVVAPRVGPARPVPGPPKRFAQAIGATVTLAATVALAFGLVPATYALLALLLVAATLEAAFGLCLGCRVFALLMRAGVIPAETCEACADVSLRAAVDA